MLLVVHFCQKLGPEFMETALDRDVFRIGHQFRTTALTGRVDWDEQLDLDETRMLG